LKKRRHHSTFFTTLCLLSSLLAHSNEDPDDQERVLKILHTAWHMGRYWTYGCALRGSVPGHLLRLVCGHIHARVVLGWGTRHGVWVVTGRVSWTDEDVRFFEGGGGGECHTRPNFDGP
jgi:hypothetical protein